MLKVIQGDLNAKAEVRYRRVTVHDFITARLLDARRWLDEHGASDADIEVVRVPGAYEIPSLHSRCEVKEVQRCNLLGAVIRGLRLTSNM